MRAAGRRLPAGFGWFMAAQFLSALADHALLIDCHQLTVTPVPLPGDVEVVVRFVAARTLEGSDYGDRVAQCQAAEAIIGPLRSASPSGASPLPTISTCTAPCSAWRCGW